uniref:Uncharacterized protein n=1 Tax=Rhizophora mucronata TaxID=61149 RepID=A0A2P2P4J5_RHIMU
MDQGPYAEVPLHKTATLNIHTCTLHIHIRIIFHVSCIPCVCLLAWYVSRAIRHFWFIYYDGQVNIW